MMKALYREGGAALRIGILAEPDAQNFIETHAEALDGALKEIPMSDVMRRRLTESNYVFSGIKAFHEANEAFPSMLDEKGNRKPFEQFLNDVRSINDKYNKHYLRAEYGFVDASAQMAAKWEQFAEDGERYDLQYRTAGDDRVRPEHAALNNVTLPFADPFWREFYPPNGWNCRCTVVQVRKNKYPTTPHEEAMNRGEEALANDKHRMFRFNPGIEQKAIPDYNPYTISRCCNCDAAKGKLSTARPLDQDLCNACQLVRSMDYEEIETERGRVRVHEKHGQNERADNIEIARYLANKYGRNIVLRQQIPGQKNYDATDLTLGKKQEYKRNNTATYSAIDKAVRKAKDQADSIVLHVTSDIDYDTLSKAIHDRLWKAENVTEVMIIRNGKDVTYTREQMLKNDFKIKWDDFR